MDYYVPHHYTAGIEKHSVKVAIKDVDDLSLRTILYTITHVVGSATPHLDLQSHFQYVIECKEPQVFNWSDDLLKIMKKQLTNCRTSQLKQFEYILILVSFFLERVLVLRLQHVD
jgi:hypothetical protein